MVKIRLARMGAKHKPYYRIVVADARMPRDGRFIESIGYYHPVARPTKVTRVDQEKALEWLKKGAQPTNPVKRIFTREGVLKRFKESTTVSTNVEPEMTSVSDEPSVETVA
ncbi:MAG: 30S ribosomal protein S16 [bacterium]|nr:30S ribosomal protein S16 [bacterium]